jgi:hypothetical protein
MFLAGPIKMHALEATAYTQFVDSNFFKDHLVPQESTACANSFIEALSPLLPATFAQDSLDFFRTRMSTAFTIALQFKASTVLMNSRRYQFQIYYPGSQKEVPSPQALELHKDQNTCKTLIQARLNVYNTVFFNQINRQANVLLDTNNFILDDDTYSSKPCIHSKAIVASVPTTTQHQASSIASQSTLTDCPAQSDVLLPNSPPSQPSLSPTKVVSPFLGYFCSLCNTEFTALSSLTRHKKRRPRKLLKYETYPIPFYSNTGILSDLEQVKISKSNINPRRGTNKQQIRHRKVQHSCSKDNTETTAFFPGPLGNHTSPSESNNDAHIAKILSELSKIT